MQTDIATAAHAYRQALEQIDAIAVPVTTPADLAMQVQQIRDAARRALQWTIAPPAAHEDIVITSGYGQNTKRPFVSLSMQSPHIQLETPIARDLALQLFDAAAAAETDKIVFDIFTDDLDMDLSVVANIISRMRKYRYRLDQRDRISEKDSPMDET